MDKLSEIVGLMIFGLLVLFIAYNKTARSIISNWSLPGLLAKTKKQKERVDARTRIGFLVSGIIIIVVAFIFLIRYGLK
jgi:hypothetical protein